MRARVDDADNLVNLWDVLCLDPILKCGIEAARGRLLDNHRLRRRKLDLDNGGDLGNRGLWRQDERKRVAAFRLRRR